MSSAMRRATKGSLRSNHFEPFRIYVSQSAWKKESQKAKNWPQESEKPHYRPTTPAQLRRSRGATHYFRPDESAKLIAPLVEWMGIPIKEITQYGLHFSIQRWGGMSRNRSSSLGSAPGLTPLVHR